MKYIWMGIGFICLALGSVGIALPILPTVPFYMLTAFCFAKSSESLHSWFINTKLYKKHLESFVETKTMTLKSKIMIMVTVTIIMTVGFILMKQVLIGRICLVIVWVFHLYYFSVKVKTTKQQEAGGEQRPKE